MKISYFFALLILASLSSCAGYSHAVTENRFIGESFGFCNGMEYGSESKQFMKSLGATYARRDIFWDEIQDELGSFDFTFFDEKLADAKSADLNVIATLLYDVPWIHENPSRKRQIDREDFPAWVTYVEASAQRYGDEVDAFEVWNEPNHPIFWTGSDELFFDLTKITVKTLKRIAPNTPISVGTLLYHPIFLGKSWLKKFLASGAAENVDALSIHFYGTSPVLAAKRLVEARRILDAYGFEGEIWVTEFGLTTGGIYPHQVRPKLQGAQAAKWISMLYAAGADRLIWYQLFDRHKPGMGGSNDSESLFGVAYRDFELKKGGQVMQYLLPNLIQSHWAPELAPMDEKVKIPYVIYPFQGKNNLITAVAWNKIGGSKVTLKGFPEGARIYNTKTGQSWRWKPGDYFTLNTEPIIIKGESKGAIRFSH